MPKRGLFQLLAKEKGKECSTQCAEKVIQAGIKNI